MANGSFVTDLINPVINYVIENKPYHTKLAEVVQIFTHEDFVNISFQESWQIHVTLIEDRSNEPITCPPAGFSTGSYDTSPYDEPGSCDTFPDTFVHVNIQEELQFTFGSVINLNDTLKVFFCDTKPYDHEQATYIIPGTNITSSIVRIDTQGVLVDVLNNSAPNQFHIVGNTAGRFTFGTMFLIQGSTFNNKARHVILNINNIIGPHSFAISGNFTIKFRPGYKFTVVESTGNDGIYTVSSSTFIGGQTTVRVLENISSPVINGVIEAHWMAETAYHNNTPVGTNTTIIRVREQIIDGSVIGSVILPSITIREYLNSINELTDEEFEREGFDTCGYNVSIGQPLMFDIMLNPSTDNINASFTDTGFTTLPQTINGGGMLTQQANASFTETIRFFVDTLTFSDTIGISVEETVEPIESS